MLVFVVQAEADEVEGEEKAKTIKVGDRCEVSVKGGGGARRGAVRYVGRPQFGTGWWIGVQYDEPVGKNNGGYVTRWQCHDNTVLLIPMIGSCICLVWISALVRCMCQRYITCLSNVCACSWYNCDACMACC